jgi:hypothetical protein
VADSVIGIIPSQARTVSGQAGPVVVDGISELAIDLNVSAVSGTTPTLQFILERLGADGVWYSLWTSAVITAITQVSESAGPGEQINQLITSQMRLRWVIGGTTPSFTFSGSVIGK